MKNKIFNAKILLTFSSFQNEKSLNLFERTSICTTNQIEVEEGNNGKIEMLNVAAA